MKKMLVVGAIHMDIWNGPEGIVYEPGGEAFNFALSLASAGLPVRLLTALRPGGINRILRQAIEIAGIEPWIKWDDRLPQGGNFRFATGDSVDFSYSATSVDRYYFGNVLLDRSFRNASLIFLDCNLNKETLGIFSERAFDEGLPLCVASVSPQKADRIQYVLPYADLVFLTREEWDAAHFECLPEDVFQASWRTVFVCCETGRIDVLRIDGTVLVSIPFSGEVSRTVWIRSRDIIAAETVRLVFSEGVVLSEAIRRSLNSIPAIEEDLVRFMGGFRSIDKLVSEIHDRAEIDSLTGAFSRTSILEYLKRSIRTFGGGKGCGLVFVDLNAFKLVNDRLGHERGDQVLSGFVQMVRTHIRSGDGIERDRIGRYGGDEFLIVLPEYCDLKDDQEEMMERLRTRFESLDYAGLCPEIPGFGASIGTSLIYLEEEIPLAIARADQEMYGRKAISRGIR